MYSIALSFNCPANRKLICDNAGMEANILWKSSVSSSAAQLDLNQTKSPEEEEKKKKKKHALAQS